MTMVAVPMVGVAMVAVTVVVVVAGPAVVVVFTVMAVVSTRRPVLFVPAAPVLRALDVPLDLVGQVRASLPERLHQLQEAVWHLPVVRQRGSMQASGQG